jgi:putative phage-type endonuclease
MLTAKNLENRSKGIGASESAIVLGISKFKTPYRLWMEKTGKIEPDDISALPHIHFGNLMEPVVAAEYSRRLNCKLINLKNTMYHKEYKYLLCHLDRKIVAIPKALECKYSLYGGEEWGESGSQSVPFDYLIQVQHQLAVTGYIQGDLAAFIGVDFYVYPFERDSSIIDKIIIEAANFWSCVEKDIAPPLSNASDCLLAYPKAHDFCLEADYDILDVIQQYKLAHVLSKSHDEEKKRAKDKIALFIKDAQGIKHDGKIIATFKNNAKGSRTLNIKEVNL